MNNTKVATTIKIEPSLYDEFKHFGVRHKITLQNLVNKTMYRYVKEELFRNEINTFILPINLSNTGSIN